MLPLVFAAALAAGPGMSAPTAKALIAQHGDAQKDRIERGLAQLAPLWRKEDGDLTAFAKEQFVADPALLDQTFARYEANVEALDGHFNEISRELRRATDLDLGPLLPIDPSFAALDPAAHLTEDLFQSKVGFAALLNFPLLTLEQKLARGKELTRRQWAEARLTDRFTRRVPAAIQQEATAASSAADLYIAQYNVWMHHLLDDHGERLFPKGLRLISHWNLRDELKADYADAKGLAKQRMIVKVMERIVAQSVPAAVIDNPRVDWNPFSNAVTATPEGELEEGAPPAKKDLVLDSRPEPDRRYARLLAHYTASRKADPFSPIAPTAIARAFDLGAEMSEARVKGLLTEILESKWVPKVGAEIQRRLGRPLEPQDVWFNGFVPRGKIPEAELDAKCQQRYPTADAFAKDIPRILRELGFTDEKAKYLASHVVVDPSRGAGHAMQAMRRGDLPHLRTRVEAKGMNYKGYNIAVHELGHNIEQVFSLYGVDHTLLSGVPNTAFTEALAFVFQAKDLELLGLSKPDAQTERLRVHNDFWMTWEIAGVALVDLAVWHWMYDHPRASPAELRKATMEISASTWNRYYAPVLGGKDVLLLGVYSHMVSNPLYLFNYPLGHLIAFQIDEHVKKAGKLGPEE